MLAGLRRLQGGSRGTGVAELVVEAPLLPDTRRSLGQHHACAASCLALHLDVSALRFRVYRDKFRGSCLGFERKRNSA